MTTEVDVFAGVGSGVMIGVSEAQELTMIKGRDIVARMMVALVDIARLIDAGLIFPDGKIHYWIALYLKDKADSMVLLPPEPEPPEQPSTLPHA